MRDRSRAMNVHVMVFVGTRHTEEKKEATKIRRESLYIYLFDACELTTAASAKWLRTGLLVMVKTDPGSDTFVTVNPGDV